MTDDELTEDDLQNPKHWHARAEETREKANAMGSPDLKERMLQIALDYDGLAERVKRESAESGPQDAVSPRSNWST